MKIKPIFLAATLLLSQSALSANFKSEIIKYERVVYVNFYNTTKVNEANELSTFFAHLNAPEDNLFGYISKSFVTSDKRLIIVCGKMATSKVVEIGCEFRQVLIPDSSQYSIFYSASPQSIKIDYTGNLSEKLFRYLNAGTTQLALSFGGKVTLSGSSNSVSLVASE